MPSLSLRRATDADTDAILGLTRAAYADWAALIGREPKPMTADYGRAVREHHIDLHEIDGHLIALIEMVQHPDHLLIENIAVRPDHHGLGLGGALMDHAETTARGLGYTEIQPVYQCRIRLEPRLLHPARLHGVSPRAHRRRR